MRNHLISAVIGVAAIFAFSASKSAIAFVASQNGVATAAAATTNVIEVKRSPHKARPPGWSHGRKSGWHGRSRPPGQI
jgi:hypothetical protein